MQLAYGQADWGWCCNGKLPETYTQHVFPQGPDLCLLPPGLHLLSKAFSSWFKKLHISLLNGDRGRKTASQGLSFERVVLLACWCIS